MRKSLALALIAALALGSAAAAESPNQASANLRKALRDAIQGLSKAYLASRPPRVVRDGLALIGIQNGSKDAEANKIGQTVSAFFEEELAKSTVFFLVDRENLGKLLEEKEFALSGMVDDAGRQTLAFASVDAMVAGSVVDSGDSFHVELKLIDANTSETAGVASFDLKKSVLTRASEDLQYSYVAANGIGITTQALMFPMPTKFFSKQSMLMMADIGASYRPNRNLMFTLGDLVRAGTGSQSDFFYGDHNTGPLYDSFQPGLLPGGNGNAGLIASGGGSTSPIQLADFSFNLLHLDAQYTINFSPHFNLGLVGGVLLYAGQPTMSYSPGFHGVGGLFYREQYWNGSSYDYLPAVDQTPVLYTFGNDPFAGLRAEIKPEAFLTRRLALSAKAGYLWTPAVRPILVKAGNAQWDFHQDDVTTWSPQSGATAPADTPPVISYDPSHPRTQDLNKASWTYYGWNPLVSPDGSRWVFDLSGFYASVAISLFF